MSTPAPNVNPLVRVGAAAHFQLYNRMWHRTEHYPSKCTCDVDPLQSVVVKPSVDDSWRYAPDDTWAPCISRLMRDHYSEVTHDGPRFTVGMRVSFTDDRVAALYEQGKSGEWFIEGFGRDLDGNQIPTVRIRDVVTQVWAWAPTHFIKPFDEQPEQPKPKESSMGGMAEPPRDKELPIKAQIPLRPTDDEMLTCVFCHREQCTHEIDVRLPGQRSAFGVHGACIRGIVGVEIL